MPFSILAGSYRYGTSLVLDWAAHSDHGLGATFLAPEVVLQTLLTLAAWDFVKLTRSDCEVCGQLIAAQEQSPLSPVAAEEMILAPQKPHDATLKRRR